MIEDPKFGCRWEKSIQRKMIGGYRIWTIG